MSEALSVKVRDTRGKRNARRMRNAGEVPAVLYGHGKETQSLTVPADQVAAAVRHGARLVELQGDVTQKAFIRELQWDVYGTHVLHMDLTRVSEDQQIRMKIQVELRGIAPGLKEGGVIEHLLHELEIECPAGQIPDKLQINVNELKLGDEITVGGMQLPPGVRVLAGAEEVVVHCVLPKVEAEAEPGEGGTAEPEIIGRKATEEETEEG